MTKTASIVAVSLFVSGLYIAPFAMATSAKQSKMNACNAKRQQKDWVKGRARSGRLLCKNAFPQSLRRRQVGLSRRR